MTELIWDGKYKDGKKVGPVRIQLPFQIIEQLEPTIEGESRSLSSMEPFAYSRTIREARKCIFNYVPCDNDFEHEFARDAHQQAGGCSLPSDASGE